MNVDEPPDPDNFTDSSPCPANDPDLAAQCEILLQPGIVKVTIRYEGSGDSGGVEQIEFEPDNITVPEAIEDKLRDLAEGYCPDGYENNDGGYGTLILWPALGLAQLEHYDRYEDSESIHIEPTKLPDALKDRLSQAGVAHLTANFDGSGDSGQIEGATIEPDCIEISDELWNDLDDVLLGLLPGGWENNEGGFGEFDIDVPEGSVTVDANWRIASQSDSRLTQWKWRK